MVKLLLTNSEVEYLKKNILQIIDNHKQGWCKLSIDERKVIESLYQKLDI